MLSQPLILTVKLEKSAFDFFDNLRRRHFPPDRNFIPAHITLFHALPGEKESLIEQSLRQISAETETFQLEFVKPRFLGKGTAIEIESQPLGGLRGRIASRFDDDLTAQDRQNFRPHITIQNKVAPDAARRLYNQIVADWQPFSARAEGLQLWEYLGGPWRLVSEFDFNASENGVSSENG